MDEIQEAAEDIRMVLTDNGNIHDDTSEEILQYFPERNSELREICEWVVVPIYLWRILFRTYHDDYANSIVIEP